MIEKYAVEFILVTHAESLDPLKSSLAEFAEVLEIADSPEQGALGKNLKVRLNTEEPTAVFDICYQFGRIKSVKVDEIK